jgi:hypothetical protein
MTPRLAPAAMGSEKVADAISRDAISEATATASGIPVVSTTAGSVAAPLFGGFAPGYFDNGYGGQQPLYIQQNVATSANAYSIVDMPGSTGIRSEPAAQPVIYVIKGPETRHEPVLMRKGSRDRPGAKMLAVNPGREVATGSAPTASGPRIVEVTARRGL